MKIQNYIYYMLLSTLAVGCSKGDSTSGDAAMSSDEITMISAADSELTRGSVVDTFDEVKSLSVYAFHDDMIYIDNRQPSMDNDGYWVFTPAINWPESDGVGFVAYSPYIKSGESAYNSAGLKLSCTEGDNSIVVDYLQPEDVSKQQDLLVASEVGVEGEVVELTFKHAFAAVGFKLTGDAAATLVESGMTVTGVCDNAQLTATSDGFAWSGVQQSAGVNPREYEAAYVAAPAEVDGSLVSADQYLMMIPQTIPDEVTIKTTLSDGTNVTAKVSGEWKAGRVYTYVLKLEVEEDKPTLSVLNVEVKAWQQVNLGDDADLDGFTPQPGTDVDTNVDGWGGEPNVNLAPKS